MYNPARLGRGLWLIGLLALLTLGLTGWAQINPPSSTRTGEERDLQKLFGRIPTTEAGDGMFFEGPIDPTQYIVGPGDQLKLTFWQPQYAEYPLVVSGEGDV